MDWTIKLDQDSIPRTRSGSWLEPGLISWSGSKLCWLFGPETSW